MPCFTAAEEVWKRKWLQPWQEVQEEQHRQWPGNLSWSGLPEVQGSKFCPVCFPGSGGFVPRGITGSPHASSAQPDMKKIASVFPISQVNLTFGTVRTRWAELDLATCLVGNLKKPGSRISSHPLYAMLDYIVTCQMNHSAVAPLFKQTLSMENWFWFLKWTRLGRMYAAL